MSNKELLITLGLDDSSYTKKINRANNLTKEYKKEIDKLASSVGDMEKDVESLSSAYKSYEKMLDVATLASKEHKKQMASTTDEMQKLQKEVDNLKPLLDAQKKSFEGVSQSLDKSSDEYKNAKKNLESLQQQYDKAAKNLEAFTNKNIKANTAYNKTQEDIQKLTSNMMELDQAFKTLTVQDPLQGLEQDSKSLAESFERTTKETYEFGTKLEHLAKEQVYLGKQTEITNKVFLESKRRMEETTKSSEIFKNEINRLQKEINEMENSLEGVDQNSEVFAKTTANIEELRLAITTNNQALKQSNLEFENSSKSHQKAKTSLDKLSTEMLKSAKTMDEMLDAVSLDSLTKEVDMFTKLGLNKLDSSIQNTRKEFELFKKENVELKGSFSMLGAESDTLNSILADYKAQTKILNSEIKKSTNNYDVLQKEVSELTQEYEKQVAIGKKLGTVNGAKNFDEALRLKKIIEEKTLELQKQDDVLVQLNSKHQKVTDSVKQTKIELGLVGKKIEQAFGDIKFNYFVKEVDDLANTTLKNLNVQLAKTEKEFKEFSSTNTGYKNTMVGVNKELEFNKNNLVLISNAKEKLNGITKEYDINVKKLKDNLRKNNDTLKKYEKQLESLRKDKDTTSKAFTDLSNKIKTTNNTIQQNSEKLKEATSKYENASNSLKQLEDKVDNTKISITNLNKAITGMKETKYFKELDKDIHKLADQGIAKLKTEFQDGVDAINKFTAESKELENTVEYLNKRYILLAKNIDLASTASKEIKKEFQLSSNNARELDEEIEKLIATNKEYQATIEKGTTPAKHDAMTNAIKENNTLIEKKTALLKKEEARVKALQTEYKQLNKSIDSMSLEGIESLKKMDKVVEQLKFTEVEVAFDKLAKDTLKRFNKELSETQREIKELKFVSDGYENTAKGLSSKIDLIAIASDTAQDKTSFLNKEMKKTDATINELDAEYKKLMKTIKAYDTMDTSKTEASMLDRYIKSSKEAKARLEVVNKELAEQKSHFNMLEQEMGQTTTQLKEFRMESDKTEDSIKKLRASAKFEEIKADVNELANKVFDRLENKIVDVSNKIRILETYNKGYGSSVDGLNQKIILQNKQLEILNLKYKVQAKEILKATSSVQKQREEYNKLNQQLKELGSQAQDDDIINLDGTITTVKELRTELEKVEKELKEQETRLKSLKGEYKSTGAEVDNLSVDIREATQEAKELGNVTKIAMGQVDDKITKTANEVNKLESAYNLAQSRVHQFGNSKKDLGTQTEYLNQKMRLLNSTIEQQKSKYSLIISEQKRLKASNVEITNEIKRLTTELGTVGRNSDEFVKLEAKIDNLKNALKENKNVIKQYDNELSQLGRELNETSTDVNNLARQQRMLNATFDADRLQRYTTRLDAIGGGLSQLGSGMMGLSMVAGTVGGAMLKTGHDFEKAMSNTNAVFNATEQEMQILNQTARELGQNTVYSAKEAAEGLKYLGMAGYTTEQSLATIPEILKLAVAGTMDLGTAADLATDSVAALGKVGDKAIEFMPDYLDKMAKLSVKANTSIEQAMSSFLKSGGQMKKLNIDIDQASAVLGLLSNRGMKAEQAGAALNSVLINLTQEGGQSGEAMQMLAKQIGYAGDNLMFTADGKIRPFEEAILDVNKAFQGLTEKEHIQFENMLGGKTRVQALTNMLGGMVDKTGKLSLEYVNLKKEIGNAPQENFLDQMNEQMNDNLAGDIKELTSAISEMFITMMEGITPQLREFLQGITDAIINFTSALASLSPQQQMFIAKLGAFVVIAPIVLNALGQFAQHMSFLGQAYGAITRSISNHVERLNDNRQAQNRLGDAVDETDRELNQQERTIEDSTDALQENTRAINNNERAQGNNNRNTRDNVRANRDNTDATTRNTTATNQSATATSRLGRVKEALKTKLLAIKNSFMGVCTSIGTFLGGVSATVVAVTAAIAIFVALAAAVGDNKKALNYLIQEWGAVGIAIAGVCEFISGIVQLTLGNLVHVVMGIAKSIIAIFTLNFDDLDNIWSETWAKMENTTSEAMRKMTVETTRGLVALKTATAEEVTGMTNMLEYMSKSMTKVTLDNVNMYAKTWSEIMDVTKDGNIDITNEMIKLLSASSEAMGHLFAGVNEGMSIETATKHFEGNLKRMLKSGKYTTEVLEKDFQKAMKLISDSAAHGSGRVEEEAEQIYEILSNTQRKMYDKSKDLAQHIKNMDTENFEAMRKMGGTWAKLFEGISADGTDSTEKMVDIIFANYKKLVDEGGDIIGNLKNEVGQAFDGTSGLIKDELMEVNGVLNGMKPELEASVNEILGVFTEGGEKTTRELSKTLTGIVQKMTDEQKTLLIENDPSGYWYSLLHGMTDIGDKSAQEIENILNGNIAHTLKKYNISFEEYKERLMKGFEGVSTGTATHIEEVNTKVDGLIKSMNMSTGQGVEVVAQNMAKALGSFTTENKKLLMESSDSWKTLLSGLEDTSNLQSEDIVKIIIGNLAKLKVESPKQMEEFIKLLNGDLDVLNADVKKKIEEANKNLEVKPDPNQTKENVDGVKKAVDEKGKEIEKSTEDVKKIAEENLALKEASTKASENLEQVKATYDSKLKELEGNLKTQGENSRKAFEDEMKKLSGGIEIDGNLIDVEYLNTQMKGAGTLAVTSFAEGFQSGSGLIPLAIETVMPDITLKLVTPLTQFMEQVTLASTSLDTLIQKLGLVSAPLVTIKDNTVLAAKEMNQMALLTKTASEKTQTLADNIIKVENASLMTVRSGIQGIQKDTDKAQLAALNLKKAIDIVNNTPIKNLSAGVVDTTKKIDLMKKAVDTAIKALKEMINLKTSTLQNQLNHLRNRLNGVTGSVTYDAKAAVREIKKIDAVTFGNIQTRIANLKNSLDSLISKANRAATAVANVPNKRMIQAPDESGTTSVDLSGYITGLEKRTSETISTFNNFKTSGGYYSPKSFKGTGKEAVKKENNDSLIKALLEQNKLLISLMTQNRDFNMSINVDGRQVAKASAPYLEGEFENFNKRKNRLRGL